MCVFIPTEIFFVISALFNELSVKIPGLGIILIISLALGLFGFVMGMVHSVHPTVDDSMSEESIMRSARRNYEVSKATNQIRQNEYERSRK